jgi:hypothetical protein
MGGQYLFNISLVIHIICITLVAGTTIIDQIVFGQFGKRYQDNKQKGLALIDTMGLWVKVRGIGFLFLILSGVGMMAVVHGVFGEQLWFRIKMLAFITIIIIGFVFARRSDILLKRLITEDMAGQDRADQVRKVSRRISAFRLTVITLFVIIFILSVFRFA